jgi:hypothetical protein
MVMRPQKEKPTFLLEGMRFLRKHSEKILIGFSILGIILWALSGFPIRKSFLTRLAKKESFGSPGTYVQLATSHVPGSVSEEEDAIKQYRRQVRHDLISMTGSA